MYYFCFEGNTFFTCKLQEIFFQRNSLAHSYSTRIPCDHWSELVLDFAQTGLQQKVTSLGVSFVYSPTYGAQEVDFFYFFINETKSEIQEKRRGRENSIKVVQNTKTHRYKPPCSGTNNRAGGAQTMMRAYFGVSATWVSPSSAEESLGS